MPHTPVHLTDQILELAAEGEVPAAEQAWVDAHLEACSHCSVEVASRRIMVEMLNDLPRFAPPAAFSDAVMARVRPAPQAQASVVRRWLPRTAPGWAGLAGVLLAPAVSVALLIAWIVARPAGSTALGSWMWEPVQDLGWRIVLHVADAAIGAGALRGLDWILDGVALIGGAIWAGVAGGVLIPLSLWLLLRLARTPMGNSPHAY